MTHCTTHQRNDISQFKIIVITAPLQRFVEIQALPLPVSNSTFHNLLFAVYSEELHINL